jgi:hypothetical protein
VKWIWGCQGSAMLLPRAAPSPGYCHRFSGAVAYCFCKRTQFHVSRSTKYLSLGAHALGHAKAQLARHQTYRDRRKPVVELGPRLAPDGNRVLEARGRHKGDARTLPLEHGIGADCSAVANIEGPASTNLRQCIEDRPRRIRWSGEDFEHLELAARDIDTVRERAAGINRYAQIGPLPYRSITATPEGRRIFLY